MPDEMTDEMAADLPPVSLAGRAYQALRSAISSGELGSGYPILEQEIADRLHMSRTPVHLALERLIQEGLLERLGRKGVFVKPLAVNDVKQAYEVAEGLEGMLVKLAAQGAPEAELVDLEEICRRMVTAAERGDIEEWSRCDREFHRRLVALGANPLIESSLARVQMVIDRVRALSISMLPELPRVSSGEHLATAKAMRARDPEHARRLHQQHWQRVRQEVVAALRATLPREVSIR